MELQPTTEAGRRLIEVVSKHFEPLLTRASDHDAEGSFPVQSFEDLKKSGMLGAFVPADLGGFGLESVRDWAIVIERLARADSSIAIGLNMHLGVSRTVAMGLRGSRAKGDAPGIARGEGMLRAIANGDLVICATATEPGTDFLRPNTTATPTEDGWSISGRKIFVTMSPVATLYALNLKVPDPDGGPDRIGFAFIPVGTPGITPQDDWNALGMRASGSQSVVLDDCRVPEGAIQLAGNWGEWNPGVLMGRTLGNVTLTGAFLGIAERARALALEGARKTTKPKFGGAIQNAHGVQHLLGEIEIDPRARAMRRPDSSRAASITPSIIAGDMPSIARRTASRGSGRTIKPSTDAAKALPIAKLVAVTEASESAPSSSARIFAHAMVFAPLVNLVPWEMIRLAPLSIKRQFRFRREPRPPTETHRAPARRSRRGHSRVADRRCARWRRMHPS